MTIGPDGAARLGVHKSLLIRSQDDVLAIMRPGSLLHPFRRPAALLDVPELSAGESADWADRLARLRNACGCTAAVIGLGAFTLASVLFVLAAARRTAPSSEPDYPTILFNGLLFFAGVIVSTLLGKLVGLSLATLRFRRTCRALQVRLATLRVDR
jgi:hypothetical protein